MDNMRGAVLMVLAMLGFALEDMFIKLLSGVSSVGQILVMLGTGGGIVFGVIVLMQGKSLFSRDMLSAPIGLRALGEMVGTVAFVSALSLTPISSASAILQATPLVVTLGAALFLGEPVGWRRWSAICVGLFGVLLIIRPGMDSFQVLSLLAVVAVFMLALRDLATRRTPATISTMQLSFLGFIVLIPAGALLMLASGNAVVIFDAQGWIYFCAALTIGVFAYYAIVAAMRVGEVSFVTPFRYARLVFALIIGVIVFAESPDMLTLIGAAIIVLSGIYSVWRERRVAARA
ncbi:DMT family transporter [Sulfitobacter sp. M57]|uniref:DMT family transporter n=1 Tax=unclassified Sulfitobacter TaxID=196795 RepID=UPI0023E149B7|nr:MULTISPECIES: DMT family transporter [unclassified Sulfitobacter]MDF3413908.1 DMT family transporter [Sulfitobacter sp. KE5]MDF3420811.1 DMT family transporter [Sulfitobacter sp. KE43]MDF3432454.1 DMT family transporter [Sulfitobacter sp. KE42]MDF3458093.1 DMT family transporter [Sulfitobacter sp. S74]MDF3461994.1 DMT family transporter [Sulfitobacter sp. Ks18]